METTILAATVLLALAVWRVVLAELQFQPLRRETATARDNASDQHPPILEQTRVGIITGNGWNPGSYRIDLVEAENRAEMYLRRIVALTEARQKGQNFILDVATTRFLVRDRYVRRLNDFNDPKSSYVETCFYSGFQGMPKLEQIATVLLLLRNNPELFDKWSFHKDIAIKADGKAFGPVG